MIQGKLAWLLPKDDMQICEGFHIYIYIFFFLMQIIKHSVN